MSAGAASSSHRPGGRREHKKHVTRRELLAAGRRLFGEKGLYESSIEDLSRRAGVAKGTLYGYFASKEELVEAVVTSGFSELLGYSQNAVQGAATYADVVKGLVEAHVRFFAENPDLMRVFHQVRGLLKFQRPEGIRLRTVLAKHLAGIAHLLAVHYPAPKPAREELLETASLLFGAVSGIVSTRASLASPGGNGGFSQKTVPAVVALVTAFMPAAGGPTGRMRREAVAGRPRAATPKRAGRRAPAGAARGGAARPKPRTRG